MGKILVISNMYPSGKFPSYGIFVKRFCDQLDALGIKYELCVMYKASNKIEKIRNYLSFYTESLFFCLIGKYDQVYVHYASYSTPAVLLARKFKKFKLVINAHGSDVIPENHTHEKMQKYSRKAFEIADTIVVPSDYFRNVVSEKYNVDSDKIIVYPSSGIDPNVFHPCETNDEKIKIKEKLKLNPEAVHIGCVGRMSAGKGWLTFIDSLPELLSQRTDIEIVIVGDGNEKQQVMQRIDELGIRNRIVMFPLLDQEKLSKLYRTLDVFVFPTERAGESLGLVAIEAMASGAVVIASDYAAPKYYLIDGENGFKYRKADSKALNSKLHEFLNMDKEKATSIKEKSLKTAAMYQTDAVSGMLQQIIMGNN